MKKWTNLLIGLVLIAVFSLQTGCQSTAVEAPAGDYLIKITQVDTTEFPKVSVYVSVTDKSGEPQVINTGKLQLLENGKPVSGQDILGTGEAGPLTTMLLIDTSGSMNFVGKLDSAKSVAGEFIQQMRPGDKAGIITFNTKVALVQEVTDDKTALAKALASIKASDDTAIYDALLKAIDILNPLSGRKAVIVMTDGMDNASKALPEEALGKIGFGGLSISTIGFGQVPEGEETADVYKGIDEPTLKFIAESAGGKYGFAEDKGQLSELYSQMRRALQSEAVITYATPLALRDGVQRALTVTLSDRYIGTGGQSNTSFNPGGLVPEVAQPASWLTFGIVLAVLVFLLLIPNFLAPKDRKVNKIKKKVKITLKD